MGRTAEVIALATASALIFIVSSIVPIVGWLFALLAIDAMWARYNGTCPRFRDDSKEEGGNG